MGLLRPNGVAVASDGTLYVMDRGNYRVAHLSADGRLLGAFGELGTGPGQFFYGWDIVRDAAGNLYVCNMVRNEGGDVVHDGVKMFDAGGRFLRELGNEDYAAADSSHSPYGLDADDQGRLYVVDYRPNTLRVFDAQGTTLATFFGQTGSADGEFNGLHDVAVDDPRGLVYLCDEVNGRIQQFSLTVTASGALTLTHRLTFGTYGRAPGQFAYPQYLAVDERSGRLYVGDMANRRIQAFDPEGRFLAEFSPPDIRAWQVLGLTVGPDGAVYAADAFNNVIWVFEPDGRLRARLDGRR